MIIPGLPPSAPNPFPNPNAPPGRRNKNGRATSKYNNATEIIRKNIGKSERILSMQKMFTLNCFILTKCY